MHPFPGSHLKKNLTSLSREKARHSTDSSCIIIWSCNDGQTHYHLVVTLCVRQAEKYVDVMLPTLAKKNWVSFLDFFLLKSMRENPSMWKSGRKKFPSHHIREKKIHRANGRKQPYFGKNGSSPIHPKRQKIQIRLLFCDFDF